MTAMLGALILVATPGQLGVGETPAPEGSPRHDAFTSWPQADRIAARLPHADVVVFERSGHFPWIEEPDSFFATITNWLRTHDVA